MLILNHVKLEDDKEKVAKYTVFPPENPAPEPLVMLSASRELAYLRNNIIRSGSQAPAGEQC